MPRTKFEHKSERKTCSCFHGRAAHDSTGRCRMHPSVMTVRRFNGVKIQNAQCDCTKFMSIFSAD